MPVKVINVPPDRKTTDFNGYKVGTHLAFYKGKKQ